MTNLETLKANLNTLKSDRRKIIALTERPTPSLDDSIRALEIKVAAIEDCQCFPESCHECFVDAIEGWNTNESER